MTVAISPEPAAETSPDFVSRSELIRKTGISLPRVGSLVAAGRLRVETLPGQLPRYSLADGLAIKASEGR
jgi:hypothetical protein